MRFAFSVLAALLIGAPALAQSGGDLPLLTPGHQDLAIDALTFEDQAFDVRTGPTNQSIGTVTQTVVEDGAYVMVVTEVDIPQFRQASTDSVRILRASLAPQMSSTTAGDNRAGIRFDALRAIGTYGRRGRELPIDLELKTPAFHSGSTSVAGGAALAARAVPFEDGYEARLETFSPNDRLRETTLTVTGRENAERLDGSTVSAWVVRAVTPGRQTITRHYYVDPETRDLLKVVTGEGDSQVVVVAADPEMLAAAAAARAATPRVRPGDTVLMAERIRTGETVSTLNLMQPMAQPNIGTQTQRVMVDEAAGTLTVVTVVEVPMQSMVQTDSVVVAYPSLRPVSQAVDGGGVTVALAYADDAVSGSVETPGGAEDVEEALPDGPVFAASMLAAVLQSLPLADGYGILLETFAPGGGLTPVAVEVSGSDGAFVVVATPEGAPPSTYTIDAETREILSVQTSPQQGVTIEIVPQQ